MYSTVPTDDGCSRGRVLERKEQSRGTKRHGTLQYHIGIFTDSSMYRRSTTRTVHTVLHGTPNYLIVIVLSLLMFAIAFHAMLIQQDRLFLTCTLAANVIPECRHITEQFTSCAFIRIVCSIFSRRRGSWSRCNKNTV